MSYLYAVNRDNPLGYFPIDADYTYYNLKNNYSTYGGTKGNDHTSGNLYDSFAGFKYGYMNTLRVVDATSYNNNPSILGISYSSPIVMGNKTSAKFVSSSSVEIKNIYDVFVPSSNPHTWSTEFWASFDWMDGQSLDFTTYDQFSTNNFRSDIGFRDSISKYPKIYLLTIGYYTTVSGSSYFYNYASILYNQETNSIEFYVPQQSGGYAKAYCVVTDLSTPIHIYATYSNKTINVSVNGKTGISAYVGSGLFQDTNIQNNYQNLIFRVAGSYNDFSTTPPTNQSLDAGQYFLVSNLTFYDYLLTARQLNNHIKWGMYDNKPVKSSTQYGTYMFGLEESPQNFQYGRVFSGTGFKEYSDLYNLNITSNGLEPQKINRVLFNNIDGASTLNAPADHSGIDWSGGRASLDFSDFGKISTMPCTISLILEPMTGYQDEYILSINNVNGSSTLFVDRVGKTYNLKFYDTMNGGTVTTLCSVTAKFNLEYQKLALSFANNSVILTVIDAASEHQVSASDTTVQSAPYNQTFTFSNNSILTIGQSYHNGNNLSSLTQNTTIYSYLAISDLYISDFTNQYINGYYYANGYPWTGLIKYNVPLQYYSDPYNPVNVVKSFPVYQMGHWTVTVPLSAMDSVLGSKVGWSSTNNCLVEYSFYDPTITHQETNWYSVNRKDGFISGYNFSNKLSNMLLRVTIITKYDVQDINQSFNNLELGFYKNMNFYSEGEYFLLTPGSRSSNGSSFTVKSHGKPIQTRSSNLGLLFPYSVDDASVPGYANIQNTYSKNVAGIDFWYRPDTNFTNTKILSGDSSILGYPDLYIDSTNSIAYNSGVAAVYVNGLYVSNSATASSVADQVARFAFTANTPVHICVVFNGTFTGGLTLNGNSSNSGSESSYGYINIWENGVSEQDAINRYNLFTQNSVSIVANDNTMSSSANPVLFDLRKTMPIVHKIGS